MSGKKFWLSILAISVVLIAGSLAVSPIAIADDDDDGKKSKKGKWLIAESTLLEGLAAGALFPYIDTTPNKIVRAHVALTDATAACDGDDTNQPTNIGIIAGEAGVALAGVTLENTGIGTTFQCVFHATIIPSADGVPSKVTDIVVSNGGGSALTGNNTITASAEVRP